MYLKPILPALVLALALPAFCLNAADPASATKKEKKKRKKAVAEETSPAAPLSAMSQKKVKRAQHLAEKEANRQFLNSPEGIAFKNQIVSAEQEMNAVYERYLNISREDPASEKGRKLYKERDSLIKALILKKKKVEGDYEKLKATSPVYRVMFEKTLKSEMSQVKGKLKSPLPEDTEAAEDEEGNDRKP